MDHTQMQRAQHRRNRRYVMHQINQERRLRFQTASLELLSMLRASTSV